MRKVLLFSLLFLSLSVQAEEFYSSKLLLKDGSTKSGYSTLPSNQLLQKSIKFKSNLNGKPNKIDSDEIYRIIFTLDNGNQYLFERSGMLYISKKYHENKKKHCEKLKQNWILAIYYGENIVAYNLAQKYFIDKNNAMVSKSVDNSGTWADILLLVKKPDESCAAMIGHIAYGATIIGQEQRFRKVASIYFNDKEDLVERINNKEFKSSDIVKLAEAYNELF